MAGPRAFKAGIAVAAVLLLAAVGAGSAGAVNLPIGFQDQVVFSGLQEPTNFKFAPDGRVFVALKNGKIMVYESLTDETPEVVDDLSAEVYDYSDHGLLGLAVDPGFPLKPYIYALFSYDHVLGKTAADGEEGKFPRWGKPPTYEGDPCPESNGCLVSGRLVRLTLEGNHVAPGSEKVLIEDWCQQFGSHSIGDLGFGPEGALYVSGGDGASFTDSDYGQFGNPCGDPPFAAGESLDTPTGEGGSLRSQSALRPSGSASLDGALLRVDPETGEGWPGNPLAASPDPNRRRIIGFGFRNPFRFVINPRTDSVYVGNVGNVTDEEIDQVPMDASGAYNSGWPCYEAVAPEPRFESLGLNACDRLYSTPGSTSSPLFYYGHGSSPVVPGEPCSGADGSAISGEAFYEGSQWPPEYHDALIFADSVRGCVYVMFAGSDGDPDPMTRAPLVSESSPYAGADIEQGPEGNIFYGSLFGPQGGTIHRISYDPGAPRASLEADREWGALPLKVSFNASGSVAAEGHLLKYEWDLDGDGNYEAATSTPTKTMTYSQAQNVEASVRVKDQANGKVAVARLNIYPGDSPPAVTIAEPAASLTWGVGQRIDFAGTASAEGGSGATIPASGFFWKARLLHCPFTASACHEHPLQVFPATKSGELTAPDHDYPSYINIELTATDSRGLGASQSVKIAARPVDLRLVSNPPGITLTAGTETAPAPFALTAIEGSPTTLAAPATATRGAATSASQGGAAAGGRVHTVVPSVPGTYTANFTATGGGRAAGASGSGSGSKASGRPRLVHRPAKTTTRRSARFAFAGGDRYRCRLDGRPYASCRSPRSYRHLDLGTHTFRVVAADSDGTVVGRVTRYSWRIVAPAR